MRLILWLMLLLSGRFVVPNDNGLGALLFVAIMALFVGFDKLAAWNRARRRKRNGANSPQ